MNPFILLNMGNLHQNTARLCVDLYQNHRIYELYNVIILGQKDVLETAIVNENMDLKVNVLQSFEDNFLRDVDFTNGVINIIDLSSIKDITQSSDFAKSYFLFETASLIMKKSNVIKMLISLPIAHVSDIQSDNFINHNHDISPFKSEIEMMCFFLNITHFEITELLDEVNKKSVNLYLNKEVNFNYIDLYLFIRKMLTYKSMLNIEYPLVIENAILPQEVIEATIRKMKRDGYEIGVYDNGYAKYVGNYNTFEYNYNSSKHFLIKVIYKTEYEIIPSADIYKLPSLSILCGFPFLNALIKTGDSYENNLIFLKDAMIKLLSYKDNHIDYFIKSYY